MSSKIGYILTGKYMDPGDNKSSNQQQVSTYFVSRCQQVSTGVNLLSSADVSVMRNPNIEDFWSLETIGITDSSDVTDDDKALE